MCGADPGVGAGIQSLIVALEKAQEKLTLTIDLAQDGVGGLAGIVASPLVSHLHSVGAPQSTGMTGTSLSSGQVLFQGSMIQWRRGFC